MVNIRVNDKDIELKFGIGELTAIDQELGLSVQDINLGEGLEMLAPKLQTGNLIGIAKVVKACLPNKNKPKDDEALEEILEGILDDYETFEKFGESCIEQLGKKRLTQELVKDLD